MDADRTSSRTRDRMQASPRGLFSLAPELRKVIFKLVFTTDDTHGKDRDFINLTEAQPPSNSILLTSRQFHAETRDLYKTAYRNYWKTNDFAIHDTVSCKRKSIDQRAADMKSQLSHLKAQDLENIPVLNILIWPCELMRQEVVATSKTLDDLQRLPFCPTRICQFSGTVQWRLYRITPAASSARVTHDDNDAPVEYESPMADLEFWATFRKGELLVSVAQHGSRTLDAAWKERIPPREQVCIMLGSEVN